MKKSDINQDTPFEQTRLTYEKSASNLTDYWKATGERRRHIELAYKLSKTSHPNVLELGCGPGRDAKVILEKAKEYTGIDYSKNLIKIARDKAPKGHFVVGDISLADYPKKQDVVIAFASLIHLDKREIEKVFKKAYISLRRGGIFYISVKKGSGTMVKEDEFGRRTYYLYDPRTIKELAGSHFKVVYEGIERIRKQDWLEIALEAL